MEIYIILYVYVCIIGLLIDKYVVSSTKTLRVTGNSVYLRVKNWPYLLLFIPLWLVMGLRSGIGMDFQNYRSIFFNIANGRSGQGSNIESGYYLLNKFVSFFTQNDQAIFVVVAFLMIAFFVAGFKNNDSRIAIQLAVFMGVGYYFYAMNIMRQYLAISIMCMAYHYLEEKKYTQFAVLLIIASLFHESVLVWIPVYLLIWFFRGKKFYIITFVISVIIRFSFSYLLSFALKYIPYAHYFVGKDSFVQARISWANVLVTGAVLFAYLLRYKRMNELNENNALRIKYVWIMFLSYCFFNALGDSVIRLVLHFFFMISLLITDFIESFNIKLRSIIKILLFVFLGLLMVYLLNYSGNRYHHFVPYVSCFDK